MCENDRLRRCAIDYLRPIRKFVPVLAGSTSRERLLASLGTLVGIGVTAMISSHFLGFGSELPFIVAPIGASAVLLFAVPSSPLAQPWSIVGGNTLSALVGVAVAKVVTDPVLATGISVSLAIIVMSVARCLHPPGGAAALTAIVGGPAISSAGYLFAFVPVGLNSLMLILVGTAFHRLSRRNYPHSTAPETNRETLDPPSCVRTGFQQSDINSALETLDETFDIDPSDLARLLRQVELEALVRSHNDVVCGQIMSRDVISIAIDDDVDAARSLLLTHNLRTLPVVNPDGRIGGTVGLRELEGDQQFVGQLMSHAVTAPPSYPALALIPTLTDGCTHAVVIVSDAQRVIGLITQTDLLAMLADELRGSAKRCANCDPKFL